MLAPRNLASAQGATPYVQVGIERPENMGYSVPNVFIQPGVEYGGKRLTTLKQFNYGPGIEAPGVQGLGYSVGFQAGNYARVTRFVFLGGGLDYVDLKTSVCTTSTGGLFAVGVSVMLGHPKR